MKLKEHSETCSVVIIMMRHGLAKDRDEAQRLCDEGYVYLNYRYPLAADTRLKPGEHILSVHKKPTQHADTFHTVTFRTMDETDERRDERERYELMNRIAQSAEAERKLGEKTDLQVADVLRFGIMADTDMTSVLFGVWEQVVLRLQRAGGGPMPPPEPEESHEDKRRGRGVHDHSARAERGAAEEEREHALPDDAVPDVQDRGRATPDGDQCGAEAQDPADGARLHRQGQAVLKRPKLVRGQKVFLTFKEGKGRTGVVTEVHLPLIGGYDAVDICMDDDGSQTGLIPMTCVALRRDV